MKNFEKEISASASSSPVVVLDQTSDSVESRASIYQEEDDVIDSCIILLRFSRFIIRANTDLTPNENSSLNQEVAQYDLQEVKDGESAVDKSTMELKY
ncbi:hypothetical protein ACSBR1_034057 [Camellia fascicularis]